MLVQVSFPWFWACLVVVAGQGSTTGPTIVPPLDITHEAFFEVEIEGVGGGPSLVGNFTIGLFGSVVPATVTKFLLYAKNTVVGRTYRGTTFHRIIKGFIIQGGDMTGDDGKSGFTDTALWFPSENFNLRHVGPGWVSMANVGKIGGADTNGSQFFITLAPTHGLDGHNVVFGKIIRGMGTIRTMENLAVDSLNHDKPRQRVIVRTCTTVDKVAPFETTHREGVSDSV